MSPKHKKMKTMQLIMSSGMLLLSKRIYGHGITLEIVQKLKKQNKKEWINAMKGQDCIT